MPPTSYRQQNFFSSGERDSAVEHLVHAVKLSEVRGVLATAAPPPASTLPSNAMLGKFERRKRDDETRIDRENRILAEKIFQQKVNADRLREEARATLQKQRESYAGSNYLHRALEAKEVDHANCILACRLIEAKPRVQPRKEISKSVKEHSRLVRQISRFKPTVQFPAPQLSYKPHTITLEPINRPLVDDDQLAFVPAPPSARTTGSGGAAHTARTHVGGWQPISPHDVDARYKVVDKSIRPMALSPRDMAVSRMHTAYGWCDRDKEHQAFKRRVVMEATKGQSSSL